MKTVDIIISGGGMVGAVAANAFADAGFEVAMIEAGAPVSYAEDEARSLRVSAIAQKHLNHFTALGIDGFFNHSRIGPYQNMLVWDNNSPGALDFSVETGGSSEAKLGVLIENNHLVWAAQQCLQQVTRVHCFYRKQISEFKQTERKVSVTLNDGIGLQGTLLLACEGAQSPLRRQAGISYQQKSYHQRAIVAYLHVERAPEQTALQAFNHTGPVALLPFGNQLFSLVWSCDEDKVDDWLNAEEDRFVHGLQAHLRRDFGTIKLVSERAAFGLQQMYAEQTVKQRLVLLGDAAHVVHPLAGQGVNLGLADVTELLEQIKAVDLKDTVSLNRALRRFQRRRLSEVTKTSELMGFLYHIYQSKQPIVSWFRSAGMGTINRLPMLKKWLLSQAGS